MQEVPTEPPIEGFINITPIIKAHDAKGGAIHRFPDFLRASKTQNIYKSILLKTGLATLHESRRGKGGATWVHPELFIILENWLNKLPNQSVSRDEMTFCAYVEEAFEGVLTFERQKLFGRYYVDLYCEQLKLCIEFDEAHHAGQVELDGQRQAAIEAEHGVTFLRHDIKENYSKMINKIIRYKQAYNIVQSIKGDKMPRLGFL